MRQNKFRWCRHCNFVANYWSKICFIFLALKLYVQLLVYNNIPELLKYMSNFHSGASVSMTLLCNEGHTENWCSSRTIKTGRLTVPLINLSLLFYSFLSGLHWDQLKVKSMTNPGTSLWGPRPFSPAHVDTRTVCHQLSIGAWWP